MKRDERKTNGKKERKGKTKCLEGRKDNKTEGREKKGKINKQKGKE